MTYLSIDMYTCESSSHTWWFKHSIIPSIPMMINHNDSYTFLGWVEITMESGWLMVGYDGRVVVTTLNDIY